jgi:hypothetical protein
MSELAEIKLSEKDKYRYISQGIVAVAFDKDGDIYDGCFNWETAQTMANEGYRILAIANDGRMEKDEIQRICNYELTAALDCFGEDYQK